MTDKLNSGNSVTFTTIEIGGEKWVPLKEAYKLQDRITDLERRIRAEEQYIGILISRVEKLQDDKAQLLEKNINGLTKLPTDETTVKYLVVPYSQIEMYDDPMTAVLASNRERDAGPYGTVFEVVANWGRTREPGNDYNIERKDLEGFNSKQYNPQTRRLEFDKYVD